LLITVGKQLAKYLFHVDNIPSDFINGIINILIKPMQSNAKSLWFIYVLLEFYIIFPLLLLLVREKVIRLVLLGFFVHFIPATNYFALNQILEYMFYFSWGVFVVQHYPKYEQLIDYYHLIIILLFISSFAILTTHLSKSISKLIIGMLSIPAMHSLVRNKILSRFNVLSILGRYTFSIYLMNTICIGLSKGVIFRYMSWNGNNFLFIFPVLMTSGIYIPVLIKKHVFSRISLLNTITD